MQMRKRHKRRKVGHDVVIDQHQLGIGEPAMDDTVADAREARLTAEVSGKPLVDCRDGAVMALGYNRVVSKLAAARIRDLKMRRRADAFNLPIGTYKQRAIRRNSD